MTPSDLRAVRSALGLSGAEFARMVGAADARNVRRWEAGDNDIPGGTRKLLEALQLLPERQRARVVAKLMEHASN